MNKNIYKLLYGFFAASITLTFLFSLSFMTDVTGTLTENFKGMGVEKINQYNRLIFYFSVYGTALIFGLLVFGIPQKNITPLRLFLVGAVCAYSGAAAITGLFFLSSVISVYKNLDYASMNMMMQMYGLSSYEPTSRFMIPGFVLFPIELICSAVFMMATFRRHKSLKRGIK